MLFASSWPPYGTQTLTPAANRRKENFNKLRIEWRNAVIIRNTMNGKSLPHWKPAPVWVNCKEKSPRKRWNSDFFFFSAILKGETNLFNFKDFLAFGDERRVLERNFLVDRRVAFSGIYTLLGREECGRGVTNGQGDTRSHILLLM